MQHVDIDEAKIRLPDLVRASMTGEDIFIDTDDRQVVQLVPMTQPIHRPRFGSAKGLFIMAEDFDAPLEDFEEYM
jgi:antitoxin (DNA-binding transcriptional repressor) of toxin-antitoxin stability system